MNGFKYLEREDAMKKSIPGLIGEVALFAAIVSAPVLIGCMMTVDLFRHAPRVTVALNGTCCEGIAKGAAQSSRLCGGVISIEPDFAAKSVSLTVCDANRDSMTYVWNTVDGEGLRGFKVTKGKCGHKCLH